MTKLFGVFDTWQRWEERRMLASKATSFSSWVFIDNCPDQCPICDTDLEDSKAGLFCPNCPWNEPLYRSDDIGPNEYWTYAEAQ